MIEAATVSEVRKDDFGANRGRAVGALTRLLWSDLGGTRLSPLGSSSSNWSP